jgi:hypothetical protein
MPSVFLLGALVVILIAAAIYVLIARSRGQSGEISPESNQAERAGVSERHGYRDTSDTISSSDVLDRDVPRVGDDDEPISTVNDRRVR